MEREKEKMVNKNIVLERERERNEIIMWWRRER